MLFIRCILLLTSLVLILFQRVDIRVTKSNGFTAKISFIFFAIVLSGDSDEKLSRRKLVSILSSFKAYFKALKFLLKKANNKLVKYEPVIDQNGNIGSFIEINFCVSLIQLIISASILVYYILKNKLKRVI